MIKLIDTINKYDFGKDEEDTIKHLFYKSHLQLFLRGNERNMLPLQLLWTPHIFFHTKQTITTKLFLGKFHSHKFNFSKSFPSIELTMT